MSRLVGILMLAMCVATSAHAQAAKKIRFAAGYAFAKYLEEGGGSAPLGLYFSGQGLEDISFKAELSYHRDSEDFFYSTITLNTFVGLIGPVINYPAGNGHGFIHMLVGGREDRIEDEGNFSMGGELGMGFDLPASPSVFIRPGADFQIFTNDSD